MIDRNWLRIWGLQFIIPTGVMIAVIVIVTSNYFVSQDTKITAHHIDIVASNINKSIADVEEDVAEFIQNRSDQIRTADDRFNQTLERFEGLTDLLNEISQNATHTVSKIVKAFNMTD